MQYIKDKNEKIEDTPLSIGEQTIERFTLLFAGLTTFGIFLKIVFF